MKKTIIMLFAIAIASANTFAQGPTAHKKAKKTPEERTEKIVAKMTTELTLTADQQAKMKALILKREQDADARREEEKARKQKMDEEIKTILTPEQYQKLKEERKERKQEHHHNKEAAPATAPPAGK